MLQLQLGWLEQKSPPAVLHSAKYLKAKAHLYGTCEFASNFLDDNQNFLQARVLLYPELDQVIILRTHNGMRHLPP